MSKHLPECLHDDDTYGLRGLCICDELRACEQRMLDAAREAVEAIPAPYKIRGDFETYAHYSEGKADFKDAALSAIDVLREKP